MDCEGLENLYEEIKRARTAMSHHMPALRALAMECRNATEFGVKRGGSTVSLLLGCRRVTSYDIVDTPQSARIKALACGWWDYRVQDSRTAIPHYTDLLLFDSLHTYDQLKAELAQWGSHARKYMVFHDTVTFGEVGADGETGKHDDSKMGIMPAIVEWMADHPEWQTLSHDQESHGLLVLRKEGV